MSTPIGMFAAGSGLAIHQLLKMKARGDIDLATFLQLTAEVEGFVEERPVELDSDESGEGSAAAAALAEEEPEEVGGGGGGSGSNDDDEEEEQEVESSDEEDDDDDEEEEEVGAAPSAKVQKLDGTLRSFITKHAQAPAKIATVRKVQVSKYEPKMPIKEQPNAQTGGGPLPAGSGCRSRTRPASAPTGSTRRTSSTIGRTHYRSPLNRAPITHSLRAAWAQARARTHVTGRAIIALICRR